MDAVTRICYWNSERYEQEFDKALTTMILAEELGELASAKEEVDQLDALIDLVYIAIGGMWKLGLKPHQICLAIGAVCTSNESKAVERVAANIKANINKGENYVPPEAVLQTILDARCKEA